MSASPFRAPPDFEPAPSAVEGITVFRPRDPSAAPSNFKCPSCAATTGFAPDAGRLTCAFCGWSEAIDTARRPVIGQDFTADALRALAHGWGVERRGVRCRDCGTERAVDAGAIASSCPYCGSAHVEVAARADGAGVRPTHVLPFAVRADGLAGPVKAWLGQGWFHPSGLADLARIDRFVGIYVPYWVFEARVAATYTCEVGHTHTRTVRDHNGHTRTETYTVWTWKEGQVERHVEHVRIPATARLSRVLLGRVAAGYDLGKLEPYDPRFLAGFDAQAYDVALPEAWEAGKAEIRAVTQRACEGDAGGDKIRNLSLSAAFSDEAWRYALVPVWLTAYPFGGRTWQVLVDGVSGHVHGQKPVVWTRVYVAVALLLAPGVCSGLVGLPLAFFAVGLPVLVVAAVLLLLGIIGAVFVWTHARDAEAA